MILLNNIKNIGGSISDAENKMQKISDLLGINPDWLMMVFFSESGLDPQAVNKQSGDSAIAYERAANRATGIMQFMPKTAIGLGITNQQLLSMNFIQQLDYVYKYLKPFANKLNSYYDLYLVVFFPAAIGKPDDYVLQTKKLSAALIAAQNKSFDLNKDGMITVGEVKRAMYKKIPSAILSYVLAEKKKLQ